MKDGEKETAVRIHFNFTVRIHQKSLSAYIKNHCPHTFCFTVRIHQKSLSAYISQKREITKSDFPLFVKIAKSPNLIW